jgi:hypothetical protein
MPLATSRLAVEAEEPIWTRWRDATGECFDHYRKAEKKKGGHRLQTTWRKENGSRENGVVVVWNREATTYEPEFIHAVLR